MNTPFAYRPAGPRARSLPALCASLVASCWLALTSAPASAQDGIEAALDAVGVPQIPAGLPDRHSVATTEALPIDGVWRVNTINKRIRIEQGRAYALDRWRHLLVLEVKPDMVVLQNFRRTGAGTYSADDPVGRVALTLASDGNLDVVLTTPLFPVRYRLIQVDLKYPDALAHELSAVNGTPVEAAVPAQAQPLPGMPAAEPSAPTAPATSVPAPSPAPTRTPPPQAPPPTHDRDCTPIGIDPDTGLTICA